LNAPYLFFRVSVFSRVRQTPRRRVTTQNAHLFREAAQLFERARDLFVFGRTLKLDVKAVLPRLAAHGATLDLQQVEAAPRERPERLVERARSVRQPERERDFVGPARRDFVCALGGRPRPRREPGGARGVL